MVEVNVCLGRHSFSASSSLFFSSHLFCIEVTVELNRPCGVMGVSRRSSFSFVERVVRFSHLALSCRSIKPMVLPRAWIATLCGLVSHEHGGGVQSPNWQSSRFLGFFSLAGWKAVHSRGEKGATCRHGGFQVQVCCNGQFD